MQGQLAALLVQCTGLQVEHHEGGGDQYETSSHHSHPKDFLLLVDEVVAGVILVRVGKRGVRIIQKHNVIAAGDLQLSRQQERDSKGESRKGLGEGA